jgi:bifunctional non-homologous end joining protein LigD
MTGGPRVRLYSRPGNDLTDRFSLIVEALARLRLRSCIIDGEAVCCDNDGRPSFDLIRYRRHDASVFLYAFRPDRAEWRRPAARAAELAGMAEDHLAVLKLKVLIQSQARTALGQDGGERGLSHLKRLEGIVSKRKGSPYRSGRSPD